MVESVPVLAHERVFLHRRLAEGYEQNRQASSDMADAVESGNVWHDNAQYDEVIERMRRIDAQFTPIAKLFSRSVVVEYPSTESEVRIGSLVSVRQGSAEFSVVIVGQALAGDDEYKQAWQAEGKNPDDLEIASTTTPLASAIMGLGVGEETSYQIGNRDLKVKILGLDQAWVRSKFSSLEDNVDVPEGVDFSAPETSAGTKGPTFYE